jgi:hypothetical protein
MGVQNESILKYDEGGENNVLAAKIKINKQ